MIKRPKISSLVESQLPEFIREEYSTFVDFLKAYYEFLDSTNQDITELRDLDTTLDSFVGWFKNELAAKIPYSTINERFLLSHIKDLYTAKGSEASFHLLFKILYNTDVSVEYPSQQMLRASDGKWNQDVSIFVQRVYGNQNSVVHNASEIVTSTKTLSIEVERIQPVMINGVASTSIFEYVLNRRYYGNISVGDTLRYIDSNGVLRFSGTVLPTTVSMEIQEAGAGFKIGDLLNVNNLSGHGSILKVMQVTAGGGLGRAQFIKFGVGYLTDFTTTVSAPSSAIVTSGPIFGRADTDIGGGNKNYALSITDKTDGFSEIGGINTSDYNIEPFGVAPAFDPSYSGVIVREWATSNQDAQANTDTQAIIKLTLGSVAKYPGYYVNNDGFLNDAIFIQDSKYYQAFSYVVKIDQALDSYKSAVKNLIHPSGTALFGEYSISNEFTRERTFESILKILNFRLTDAFGTTSDAMTFDVSTLLTDGQLNWDGNIESQSIALLESLGIDTSKIVDPDTFTLDDISHLDITTSLSTEYSTLVDALNGSADFAGSNTDSMITSEYTASNMNKMLSASGHLLNNGATTDIDSTTVSDTDASNPTDLNRTTPAISYATTIDPSYYGGNDNTAAVDSGGVLELNAYAEDYFANDTGFYVGTPVVF